MGKIDNVTREYVRNREVFADICNAAVFGGNQVIKAETLTERDTTAEVFLRSTGGKNTVSVQRYRDVLKEWVTMDAPSATIAIFGIENQADIHYAMVSRSYLYDALNYENQVKYISDMNVRLGRVEAKAPSYRHFLKTDRLKPVITIVVYWGAKKWDGARSLYELLDFSGQDDIKNFVPDYRMPLVVPAEIEDFELYKTNLRYILPFIKYSDSRDAMQDLLDKYRESYSVTDRTTADLLKVLTNINIQENVKGEVINVCKAWDDQRNAGREEGIKECRKKGKEEERESIVKELIKLGQPLGIIKAASKFTEDKIRELAKSIGVPVTEE